MKGHANTVDKQEKMVYTHMVDFSIDDQSQSVEDEKISDNEPLIEHESND